jgi:hypothetical protein
MPSFELPKSSWMTLPEFVAFLRENGISESEAKYIIFRLLKECSLTNRIYCDNLYGYYGAQTFNQGEAYSVWDDVKFEMVDFEANTIVERGERRGPFREKDIIMGKDIKILRDDIEQYFFPRQTMSKLSFPASVKSGRPPKIWWDDLWIEVARRIFHDDWKPETQEQAISDMLRWLSESKNEQVERSTIQQQMSKLFKTVWGNKN